MKTIEQMAEEAGFKFDAGPGTPAVRPADLHTSQKEVLQRFAALVRAQEREKAMSAILQPLEDLNAPPGWLETSSGIGFELTLRRAWDRVRCMP